MLNTASLCRAGIACLFLAGAATASALGPLPTDGNALAGWAGSISVVGNNVPSPPSQPATSFSGFVEYAVYAPGQFSTSLALSTISPLSSPPDPSAGTDYVYAYQIWTDVASAQSINFLSVGLYSGAVPNNSNRVGNYTNTALTGTLPIISSFNPALIAPKTNVKYQFTPSPNGFVGPGGHSDILYFTSPFGPTTKISTLTGTGTTAVNNVLLPTPIPEPATFVLAASAFACVAAVRVLRKRSA